MFDTYTCDELRRLYSLAIFLLGPSLVLNIALGACIWLINARLKEIKNLLDKKEK